MKMKIRYIISLIAVLGILISTQIGCENWNGCSDCKLTTVSYSIAIDAGNNVWVAIRNVFNNGTIVKLDPAGKEIGSYYAGQYPDDISINANGNVWVTNGWNGTVTALTSTGSIIGTYPVGRRPSDIAIDAIGNIWVMNSGNKGIVTEISSTGITIGTYPVGSYLRGIAIDQFGDVWVGSSYSTVTMLNHTGAVIKTYYVKSPYGIAIDSQGAVWVTNYDSNSVTEIDLAGVKKIYHVCKSPAGIAIDASGNVWVTCSGNGNITSYISKLVGVAKGPQYWPYKGPQWP